MHTQQLLVLLFGTFRVIASNASRAETGMTSEALGVSVAPSFFHTCVSDGKTARMEDVLRFKVNNGVCFVYRRGGRKRKKLVSDRGIITRLDTIEHRVISPEAAAPFRGVCCQ